MIEILKSVPFFGQLADADIRAVADKVIMEYYPAGHVLFSEGDPGDKMYVIKTGAVQVVRGGAIIAELSHGQFFGEMALVSDEPRNATIKVTSDVEVLVLKKDDFRHLIAENAAIASTISYEVVKRANANN